MKALLINIIINTPFEPLAMWVWRQIQYVVAPKARMYNNQIVQIMSRVLKKDSNCVDIGTHMGSILRHMINFAPQGNYFAFEPIPKFAYRLKMKFPGVNVYELALSNSTGDSSFCHVMGNPGYSGFIRQQSVLSNKDVKEITVKVETLDNIIPEDLMIDFIKVDVEGAELQVFSGAIQTIRRHKPYIVFEHGSAAVSYGITPGMVYDLLVENCGLNISILSDLLEGKASLNRSEFSSQVGPHYYFVAHP